MYRPVSPSRPEKRRRANGVGSVPPAPYPLRNGWDSNVPRSDGGPDFRELPSPWSAASDAAYNNSTGNQRPFSSWAQLNSEDGATMGSSLPDDLGISALADLPVTNQLLLSGQQDARRSFQVNAHQNYSDFNRNRQVHASDASEMPGQTFSTTGNVLPCTPYGEGLALPPHLNAQAGEQEHDFFAASLFGTGHGMNSISGSLPVLSHEATPAPAPMLQHHSTQSASGIVPTTSSSLMPYQWPVPEPVQPSVHPSSTLATRPKYRKTGTNDTNNLSHSAGGSGQVPSLRLGQITPVRDALASFDDRSAAIVALRKLIESGTFQTNRSSSSPIRQQILSFAGFNPSIGRPDPATLTALSKADLESLAWAFGVQRNGRKADTARRIIQYLTSPLTWVSPAKRRSPCNLPANTLPSRYLPTVSPGRRGVIGDMASEGTGNVRPVLPVESTSGGRPSTAGSSRGATQPNMALYNFLKAQISAGQSPSSPVESQRGTASTDNARRELREQTSLRRGGGGGFSRGMSSLSAVLDQFDFMEPENPFNIPIESPLGNVKYVLFGAEQLSRGFEPVMVFQAPPLGPSFETGEDIQFHLRCLRVEAEISPNQWKQSWPFPASARVNGHAVVLGQAQRYTNGKLAGTDTATNITPFVRKHKLGSSEANKALLRRHASTASPSTGSYVCFVQRVRVKSCDVVKREVLEQSESYWREHYERHRSKLIAKEQSEGAVDACDNMSIFELAKHGVVKFMNSDGVTSSSMKVSLRCPLMLTRISTPVKGRRCLHVQCFDLDFFLMYARRSSKFLCPVCNKPNAKPSDLVVSPYIQKALDLFHCDEVEISADGSLSSVAHQRSGVRSDGDDSEDDLPNGSIPPNRHVKGEGVAHQYDQVPEGGAAVSRSETGVVDLTHSDGEDDGDDGGRANSRGFMNDILGGIDDLTSNYPGSNIVVTELPREALAARPGSSEIDTGLPPEALIAQLRDQGNQSIRNGYGPPGSIRALCDELVGPDTNPAWSCDVIALDSE